MPVRSLSIIFFTLTAIIFSLAFNANNAYADVEMTVIPAGSAIRSGNTTIQNIALNLKTKQNWKLMAVPLCNSFRNSSHPVSTIPVSQAEIQDNDTSNLNRLEFGKPVIIASGNNNSNIIKNCTVKIQTPDGYYPGTYTGTIQFTLVSSGGTANQNFDISFDQPVIQNISIPSNDANIDVLPENSMKVNYSQETSTPTRIYVRSNKDWKLVLCGKSTNNTVAYFFKTLSGTENSTLHYSDYTQLSNSNFILAEGSPTVSSDGMSIEPAIIQINYKLVTDSYSILTAGVYPYNVIFNLI